MKRLIMYRYNSWTEGCGCCSNSESIIELYEDNILLKEIHCVVCGNEAELRIELKHLEPFDVDPDSRWF